MPGSFQQVIPVVAFSLMLQRHCWHSVDIVIIACVGVYHPPIHLRRMGSWNVLTAGPSAGKTSTMRELSARGYTTVPEAARLVIDQAISEGYTPDTVRDEMDFQQLVIDRDYEIEHRAPDDRCVFFDRSLADNIAYCRLYEGSVDESLIEDCRHRYDNIFILERITFQDDYARNEESDEEAQRVHEEIVQTYKYLGYDPIHVPLASVDERAKMILDCLE